MYDYQTGGGGRNYVSRLVPSPVGTIPLLATPPPHSHVPRGFNTCNNISIISDAIISTSSLLKVQIIL